MAELIPTGISGAGVSQGQGQGYAQVFGQSSFDGPTFIANLNKQRADDLKLKAQKALDIQNKNTKFRTDLPVPEMNRWSEEELTKDAGEMQDKLIGLQMGGYDLASNPDAIRAVNDAKTKFALKKSKADAIAKIYDSALAEVNKNPEKYDREEFLKKAKALEDIKSIDGRIKYLEENPLLPIEPISITEVIADWELPYDKNEDGTVTTTQVNPERLLAWSEYNLASLLNDPKTKKQAFELYNRGKDEGLWQTPKEQAKYFADYAASKGKFDRVTDEPRQSSGGGGISIGGYSVPEKVNVEARSRWDTSGGKADEISIAYNAKDIPPFEVEADKSGKKVKFAPSKWFVNDKGEWMVEGKSYGRTGEVKIDPNDKDQLITLRSAVEGDGGTVEQVGDKYVTFTPLKTEIIPYDLNEPAFKTHLDGFDLKRYVDGWNKVNAKKGKAATSVTESGVIDLD